MKAAVVGGGLAGLAAALELADHGHAVSLYEARPTLGGAVQTLPARDGDPEPPPDNGQHIALGCFTEYLRFLERIGEGRSYRRLSLELPVIGEDGRTERIGRSPAAFLRYGHLTLGDRLRTARALRRIPERGSSMQTFGELLRDLGCSDESIERFWDVFVRPALNLATDDVSAEWGVFTVRTALLADRAASDLVLPVRPLGWMHGDAAGRALEAAGATVCTGERVTSLDDLDVDAVVVATPPAEAARLLGEPDPDLEDSPIISVHLLFDRPLLRYPLAALLGTDAHWIFDRGRLMEEAPVRGSGPVEGDRGNFEAEHKGGSEAADVGARRSRDAEGVNRKVPPWPPEAQYLTVVSSGVPELMEIRGRELVELLAGQVLERLGPAELVWSRASREPQATLALRPGVVRPTAETDRPRVVRAGAWTATGWPATMEGAVRSGIAAAQAVSRSPAEVPA